MSRFKWVRRAWTSPGADPTHVVEWSCEGYRITEFQGIYLVSDPKTGNAFLGKVAVLGEEVHKALESAWEFREFGKER